MFSSIERSGNGQTSGIPKWLKILGLFLSVFFYSFYGLTLARGQNATPTTKEIYEMASKRNERIKSLAMVAIVEWKHFPDLPANRVAPPSLERQSFAFLDEKRLNGHAKTLGEGKVDKRPLTIIFNGKNTFQMERPFVQIFDGKQPPCEYEWYCKNFLGLPITDDDKAPQQIERSYPQCLNPNREPPQDPLPYKVLPKLELIDGHLCLVLEYEKHDKLWVDPKLGGAIRQRIRFTSDGPDKPTVKYQQYSLSDYKESAPGVWTPMKASLTTFGAAKEAGKPGGQPWIELRVQVESLKINEIDAQYFNLEVPAKTILVKKEGSMVVEGEKGIRLSDIDPDFKPMPPSKPYANPPGKK